MRLNKRLRGPRGGSVGIPLSRYDPCIRICNVLLHADGHDRQDPLYCADLRSSHEERNSHSTLRDNCNVFADGMMSVVQRHPHVAGRSPCCSPLSDQCAAHPRPFWEQRWALAPPLKGVLGCFELTAGKEHREGHGADFSDSRFHRAIEQPRICQILTLLIVFRSFGPALAVRIRGTQ